jgi:hypothetical protein
MYKQIFTLLIFLLSNICGSNIQAAPSQLLPCDFVYELTPEIKLYHKHLNMHFAANGGLEQLNLDFIMYILPSFENESVIISYETSKGQHVIEHLTSQDSVWYLLNKYAEINSIQIYDISEKADINLPKIVSDRKKVISKDTSYNIKTAIEFAVRNSRYDAKEFEGYHGQLDGTSIHFITSDQKCGWPFVNSAPGTAKKIFILSGLLKDFIEDKSSEESLVTASNDIINP